MKNKKLDSYAWPYLILFIFSCILLVTGALRLCNNFIYTEVNPHITVSTAIPNKVTAGITTVSKNRSNIKCHVVIYTLSSYENVAIDDMIVSCFNDGSDPIEVNYETKNYHENKIMQRSDKGWVYYTIYEFDVIIKTGNTKNVKELNLETLLVRYNDEGTQEVYGEWFLIEF